MLQRNFKQKRFLFRFSPATMHVSHLIKIFLFVAKFVMVDYSHCLTCNGCVAKSPEISTLIDLGLIFTVFNMFLIDLNAFTMVRKGDYCHVKTRVFAFLAMALRQIKFYLS